MTLVRSLLGLFGSDPAAPQTVDALLTRTAKAHPHAPAIGPLAGAIDFAELDRRVTRVANGLAAEGGPRDRVALIGRNSGEQVELLLGAIRAGQTPLTINWRLTPVEMAYILEHSGASRVFADTEFLATAQAALGGRDVPVQAIDGTGPADYRRWRDRQDNRAHPSSGTPGDVVLQMYTSGTTGLPKGVQLTNANVLASLAIFSLAPLDLDTGDVLYAPAPMFHITGIGPVLRCIQSGARLVLASGFDPGQAVETLARERVTYTTLAPAMIQACLASPAMDGADLGPLRVIVYGGSPIAESVLREAQERIGCEFAQCYGLTETTGPITLMTPEDHAPGRGKLASCGRAVEGVGLRVVDADGNPVPAGVTGEIQVGGPLVMMGYASDPAATAETIRDGWLNTGDAGYLDDEGFLFIRDRVKDMIVSGGENIYPVEVENAIQSHVGVAEVAVIGIPDARWGEAVLALVVPAGSVQDADAVLAHCRERIAGYKCPRQIRFVDAIPRNAAGKILRRELRKPFWEGVDRLVG
ncbi:long-chain-fatty-acid--CoA ligase [Sphingomonas canadensis]|uniref:Long-chain-fatty-acid--CoA ligase n=1 Tax=Sphingomonas canadensis TaxID=1219257 RepID=A0ABW3H2I2_9SPHN|nr:long-chain-fatty-acid--CoA ligase [Sphingomonas canadensis]MCW3834447.1 long-chain-fatty-acid--CoA ligase [Sphingomonas canadensis]